MKNCTKGCGNVSDKKHCDKKGCPWWVCAPCNVVFDPRNLDYGLVWDRSK